MQRHVNPKARQLLQTVDRKALEAKRPFLKRAKAFLMKTFLAKLLKSAEPEIAQVEMTAEDEAYLLNETDFGDILAPENISRFQKFTKKSRENFAFKTATMVVYLPEEAVELSQLEEAAVLNAAPIGYPLEDLNGLNIGCGDREVHPHLIPVDIMRRAHEAQSSGMHHAFIDHALLANPETLPFKEESIDYIVALHMLEHVQNPIEILRLWEKVLKPGGGIGLILPDCRYTWSAEKDPNKFGHKWDPTPSVFMDLYETYLKDIFKIEQIATLPYKLSFDIVLRKPGVFSHFQISDVTTEMSGQELIKQKIPIT